MSQRIWALPTALVTIVLPVVIAIMALSCPAMGGPVLNNNPITFQMSGTATYMPDSGGSSRTGYKLKLGYSGKQWLAVEIVTGTNKNDVLVIQVNQFYTEGSTPLRTGHEVTVTDFYRTDDVLNYDQNTEYDISAFSYTARKEYTIDLTRYLGANSGEDWNAAANGYCLLEVCFYTSDNLFSVDSWKSGTSQCYFFEIDNYVSDFKGAKLKNFYLNGYTTGIYGWIDGPYVTDNLYIYHKVPLFTYTKEPALVIELGTTLGKVGQDFNVYSPVSSESGDYWGKSVTSMEKDTNQPQGYENGGLTQKHWNAVPANQISGLGFTALRISYRRNITTFDWYDRELQSTFIFCLYMYAVGNINSDLTGKSCEVVELSYHYPRMTMPDKAWEPHRLAGLAFLLALLSLILFSP